MGLQGRGGTRAQNRQDRPEVSEWSRRLLQRVWLHAGEETVRSPGGEVASEEGAFVCLVFVAIGEA